MIEFAIFRGTSWQRDDYCSKGHFALTTKFHVILTLRPITSIIAFLPYVLILGANESLGKT